MTQGMAELPRNFDQAVDDVLAPYETIEKVPAGKTLFREGTDPAGVWVLHSGQVELTCAAKGGAAMPLLAVDAGQILGLTSIVSGRSHDASAVARKSSVVGFIQKDRFLRLLDEKPALWLSVLRMISTDINACWDCMRSLKA
jgi:CRP/FNR family cyclic AMP-dependent transcriptional regulator